MGAIESSRTFPIVVSDLTPVATELMNHFKDKGFEVTGEPTVTRGWYISIHKGGLFKSLLGMKTALNVDLEPQCGVTYAKAGIGIFGLQAIPTAITAFIFWPLLLPQLWGIVHQAHLDDEALATIENSLRAHSPSATAPVGSSVGAGQVAATGATPTTTASTESSGASGQAPTAQFCTKCGARSQPGATFCTECGSPVGAMAGA